MSLISETMRTNVDFLEDRCNYLTLQLVQHGGFPLKPNEKITIEDLKKALATIEKNLEPTKHDEMPLKVIPQN